jgi:integrase
MANGSVYRRDDRKKPWIVHISWHEGERRRQEFVAPAVIWLRDFFETWIDSLETQGWKASTIEGYRKTMRRYVLSTLGSYQLQNLRPTDDRVFTNEIGDPLRPQPPSVGQAFRRLVESAGLSYIRPHDLRHTHALHLLAAGVNAKVVSERLVERMSWNHDASPEADRWN